MMKGKVLFVAPTVTEDIECGVRVMRLSSWEEFVPLIAKEHADSPAYIYRGQADSDWTIASLLDRLEKRFPTRHTTVMGKATEFDCTPTDRKTHFYAFREIARGKRGAYAPELDEDAWWALAQQHGLATPMLDWTYSPFIALFFAFEEEKRLDEHQNFSEPKTRAVCVLSTHLVGSRASKDAPAPKPYTPPGECSERLGSQAGLFLKMPEGEDLESYVREHFSEETSASNRHPRAILTKIVIPNEGRVECLKLLNKMNINRASLFPDLDGACAYINSLWELGFDSLLGYVLQSQPGRPVVL